MGRDFGSEKVGTVEAAETDLAIHARFRTLAFFLSRTSDNRRTIAFDETQSGIQSADASIQMLRSSR